MAVRSVKEALLLCALACGGVEGLEFGEMGDTSFGMGGAGVALENSAWGLYYNPALLDIDDRSKLGYSFGASIGQKNFLEAAAQGLNASNLVNGDHLNQLLESKMPSVQNFVQGTRSSVTLSAHEGQAAKALVGGAYALQNLLATNGVHLASQNGIVVQIHPKAKKIKGGVGTFAIGVFASAFAGFSAVVDPRYNQIILPSSQLPIGQTAHLPPYIRVGINKDNITLTGSDQNAFDGASMLSPDAHHAAAIRALGLGSVPFGYAKGFDFHKWGKLSVGVAFRYLYTLSYGVGLSGSLDNLVSRVKNLASNFSFSFDDVVRQSHFGLDLGTAYRIQGFTIGVVGKYLNAPKIRYNSLISDMRIDPQVRLGLGYRWKWLNLAMDFDLTSNKTLMLGKYNQMIGGGAMADFKWFAIKLGAMGNVAKEGLGQGVILTGGLRFFKVLDVSIQSGLHMVAFDNLGSVGGFLGNLSHLKIPTYLALRVGGGWEW